MKLIDLQDHGKRKTKIVPVTRGHARYGFEYQGQCLFLKDVFDIPNWTGRLEMTYADGTKGLECFELSFGSGCIEKIPSNYDGQDDFIPATITGVEFWDVNE